MTIQNKGTTKPLILIPLKSLTFLTEDELVLVWHDTIGYKIANKIYENIRMKVSRKESDSERVAEFIKQIKSHHVVENIILNPRYNS